MKAALKALERALILERTEIALSNALEALMDKWDPPDVERGPKPSSFDLLDALRRSGVPSLPAAPRAANYIDHCAYQGAAPDMARIFRTLLPEAPVPAYLETDDSDHLFPDEKAC